MTDWLKVENLNANRPHCTNAVDGIILSSDIDAGTIGMQFTAPVEFTSPRGSIQGGFVAAFIDEVLGLPVLMRSGGKLAPLTLDLSLSYISPVMPGTIYGEGQIVKMGRSIAYLEGQLFDQHGMLLVKATSTAKLVPAGA